MKRLIALVLSALLVFTLVPATAEQPAEDDITIGQKLDAFLEELNTWLDDTVDEVEKTAEDVADWANEQWDSVEDGAAEVIDWISDKADTIGKNAEESGKTALEWVESNWKTLMEKSTEQTRGLKTRMDDLWDSLSSGAAELFEQLEENWNDLKGNISNYAELIGTGTQVIIRESLLEYVSLVEDLAAEHQAAIPDNVRETLDEMTKLSESLDKSDAEFKLDDEAVTGFLKELGVDDKAFQELLNERFSQRLTKLGIESENICLSEYMAKNGLRFSSAALRAQDRLNRFAAGTLSMTQEEYDKAVEIVRNWVKEAEIDEEALAKMIMEYMANGK